MSEETNKRDADMAKAKEEIEQILLKYKIVLIPVVMHQGDKTISRIDIAPASTQN
jgi:hypothetical protein